MDTVNEEFVQNDMVLSQLFTSRVEGRALHPQPTSPKIFIGLIEYGVSGAILRTVTQHIPKPIVVDVVGSDPTNFSKLLRKKRLSPKQTEGLDDLTALWRELREFFAWDEESVKDWISRPLPVLEGLTASELMRSQYGRKTVREVLEAMKYGDFA